MKTLPDPNPAASELAGNASRAAFVAARGLAIVNRKHKRRHPTAAQREKAATKAVDRLRTALGWALAALDEVTRERSDAAKAAAKSGGR